MAADWLPIEFDTPRKPEVLQVAEHLGTDPDSAFGKCFRVWVWFDQHTVDGVATGVTPAMLDGAVHHGISQAMESVGWLLVYANRIEMPNFRAHCGESAKKRLRDQRRQERHRARTSALQSGRDECHTGGVTDAPPDRKAGNGEEISGPARSGPDSGFLIPAWPELEEYAEAQVDPTPASDLQHGVFRSLKRNHLGKAKAIAEWHSRQLSADRPVAGDTQAHRILCVSAALHADNLSDHEVRKSRVGVFVGIVKNQRWEVCRNRIPDAIAALNGRAKS